MKLGEGELAMLPTPSPEWGCPHHTAAETSHKLCDTAEDAKRHSTEARHIGHHETQRSTGRLEERDQPGGEVGEGPAEPSQLCGEGAHTDLASTRGRGAIIQ